MYIEDLELISNFHSWSQPYTFIFSVPRDKQMLTGWGCWLPARENTRCVVNFCLST